MGLFAVFHFQMLGNINGLLLIGRLFLSLGLGLFRMLLLVLGRYLLILLDGRIVMGPRERSFLSFFSERRKTIRQTQDRYNFQDSCRLVANNLQVRKFEMSVEL